MIPLAITLWARAHRRPFELWLALLINSSALGAVGFSQTDQAVVLCKWSRVPSVRALQQINAHRYLIGFHCALHESFHSHYYLHVNSYWAWCRSCEFLLWLEYLERCQNLCRTCEIEHTTCIYPTNCNKNCKMVGQTDALLAVDPRSADLLESQVTFVFATASWERGSLPSLSCFAQ
jgi:hypothetical protein